LAVRHCHQPFSVCFAVNFITIKELFNTFSWIDRASPSFETSTSWWDYCQSWL